MDLKPLSPKQFRRLSGFIESQIGIKMPESKRIMLESRLRRRVRDTGSSNFEEYIERAFEDPGGELVHLIDAVTTNKTDFFRESDHFAFLSQKALPELRPDWGMTRSCKVWSVACSTGEEVYTLAMVLEERRRHVPTFDYRILGTDISARAVETARAAIYAQARIEPVSTEFSKRYFLRGTGDRAGTVRVKPGLRRKAQFHRLNLMDESYPIRDTFELIFCRNVIIYFDRKTQEALLRRLISYLAPGGYLFLGHSESLSGFDLGVVSVAPTIYTVEA